MFRSVHFFSCLRTGVQIPKGKGAFRDVSRLFRALLMWRSFSVRGFPTSLYIKKDQRREVQKKVFEFPKSNPTMTRAHTEIHSFSHHTACVVDPHAWRMFANGQGVLGPLTFLALWGFGPCYRWGGLRARASGMGASTWGWRFA